MLVSFLHNGRSAPSGAGPFVVIHAAADEDVRRAPDRARREGRSGQPLGGLLVTSLLDRLPGHLEGSPAEVSSATSPQQRARRVVVTEPSRDLVPGGDQVGPSAAPGDHSGLLSRVPPPIMRRDVAAPLRHRHRRALPLPGLRRRRLRVRRTATARQGTGRSAAGKRCRAPTHPARTPSGQWPTLRRATSRSARGAARRPRVRSPRGSRTGAAGEARAERTTGPVAQPARHPGRPARRDK